MGTFLNPGNQGFARIRNGQYIDKSEMIALINHAIDTPENLICISRPRRFGKSFAAQMLCAYYDRSCDSSELFAGLEITKADSYQKYRNQFHVIYVDMTSIKAISNQYEDIETYLGRAIAAELIDLCPDISQEEGLISALVKTVEQTGIKFIMIIDEWDAPIRENPIIERSYLEFLRMLFKSSGTTARIFAAVYMTGILPIKKDGTQSAVSDFREYTMIAPQQFAPYVGFTEEEVIRLCQEAGVDFSTMKFWYDGYHLDNVGSVYNPNSVMKAIQNGRFRSYWTETSAASSLMNYISKGYTGLSKTIAEVLGGNEVPVDTYGFSNDLVTFRDKDDVLTLLIHLGYLAYDGKKETASIPNEEIRLEFSRAIRKVDDTETLKRLRESDQLFQDTFAGNEEAVAAQIEKVHNEETVPLHYNREESLRSVIKLAYYTYKDHYLQWEELPAGMGYADIVYLPKKDSGYPALVIELKWNASADGAIAQILDRSYPDALKGYGGEILLVGISYDKNASVGNRKHSCRIIPVNYE